MCVCYVSLCAGARKDRSLVLNYLPKALHTTVLRQSLSLNLEFTRPRDPSVHLPNAGLTDVWYYAQFLTWVLGDQAKMYSCQVGFTYFGLSPILVFVF